jgi:hypothetical protein
MYDFPETFRGAPDQEIRENFRQHLMKEYKKEEEEDNYYR